MRRPLAVLSAALLACACSLVTGPEEVRVLGEIAGSGAGDPVIEVPASAERGVPFAVAVRTYGNGCYRAGDTEVRVVGPSAVEVAPYDFTRGGVACPDILSASTHTVAVRFGLAGPAVVRVRGRRAPGRAELVVAREVLVR